MHDPEIASRIASYELAFRMQIGRAGADRSVRRERRRRWTRTASTATDPTIKADRGGGPGQYQAVRHATACSRGGWSSAACGSSTSFTPRGIITRTSTTNCAYNAGMADQPVAALIKDLKQRGLLDETLVVWAGEFGRTPLGENRGGMQERDRAATIIPFAFTPLDGRRRHQGRPDLRRDRRDRLGRSSEDPVHVNDFHATMLHLFGLDHLKLTHRFQGRDFRLTDVGGQVIHDWLA